MANWIPWVSRARYEQLEQIIVILREHIASTLAVEKATTRYESLVERMLEMKREGFKTMPLPTEPLKPSESALSPQVEFEIEKASSGDPSLRRRLNVWAQAQSAMKRDEAAIIHGIRYGDEPDEMENET